MNTTAGVEERFFQLLQIAVGKQTTRKLELSDIEWNTINEIACKQCLVAVVFSMADVFGTQVNVRFLQYDKNNH